MTTPLPDAQPEDALAPDEFLPVRATTVVPGSPMDDCLRAAFEFSASPMLVVRAADGHVLTTNVRLREWMATASPRASCHAIEEFLTNESWLELRRLPTDLTGLPRTTSVRLRSSDQGIPEIAVSVHRHGEPGDEALLIVFPATFDVIVPPPANDVDPLTGLTNRNEFDRRLKLAIERVQREGRPHFALLFIDLDAFKPVNDQFGHAVGDRVLAAVARRLAAGVRPGDVLSRRGGDEFTVLVDSIDEAGEARRIAERLWSRAMEPFEVDGHFLHVGASIGFVLGDGTIDNPAAMIEAADRAMYAAKRAGRPMVHSVK
ncbi:MAG: GGDEF domain-containing protein [Planctomycetia bacterium]|nr:GGDEF domain-containing protein [Planctomycetia bacterium]